MEIKVIFNVKDMAKRYLEGQQGLEEEWDKKELAYFICLNVYEETEQKCELGICRKPSGLSLHFLLLQSLSFP